MNKLLKIANTKAGAAAVAVVSVALIGYYVTKKAEQALPEIGEAINPVNDDNIFAAGVNAIGAKVTGNKHWKLGGAIYDTIN